MKQAKLNLAVFAASLCALLVLAASPVMAQDSTSGTGSSNDTTTSDQQNKDNSNDSNSSDNETENETEVHNKADMFRKDGEREIEHQRETKDHTKSKEERAKTCDQIQNAVNNKLKAFNNHASTYLTRLDSVFTKVQAYKTSQNITVSNYDALVATATQKQADAIVAVGALKSLGTTLDCTSSDPASMLAAAKSGATSARNALKAYQGALKDLVAALLQATNTTTTEAN